MNVEKKFDELKRYLDNAEAWGDISKDTRKYISNELNSLLMYTAQLQITHYELKQEITKRNGETEHE